MRAAEAMEIAAAWLEALPWPSEGGELIPEAANDHYAHADDAKRVNDARRSLIAELRQKAKAP